MLAHLFDEGWNAGCLLGFPDVGMLHSLFLQVSLRYGEIDGLVAREYLHLPWNVLTTSPSYRVPSRASPHTVRVEGRLP